MSTHTQFSRLFVINVRPFSPPGRAVALSAGGRTGAWGPMHPHPGCDGEPPARRQRVSDQVRLNVGGETFITSRSTLEASSRYFSSMFTHGWRESDEESLFIDRDADVFRVLLSAMRSRRLVLPSDSDLCTRMLYDAVFYSIDWLLEAVKERTQRQLHPLKPAFTLNDVPLPDSNTNVTIDGDTVTVGGQARAVIWPIGDGQGRLHVNTFPPNAQGQFVHPVQKSRAEQFAGTIGTVDAWVGGTVVIDTPTGPTYCELDNPALDEGLLTAAAFDAEHGSLEAAIESGLLPACLYAPSAAAGPRIKQLVPAAESAQVLFKVASDTSDGNGSADVGTPYSRKIACYALVEDHTGTCNVQPVIARQPTELASETGYWEEGPTTSVFGKDEQLLLFSEFAARTEKEARKFNAASHASSMRSADYVGVWGVRVNDAPHADAQQYSPLPLDGSFQFVEARRALL